MWATWIKEYYEAGYYTKDDVKIFVQAGYITLADYQTITGDPYTP